MDRGKENKLASKVRNGRKASSSLCRGERDTHRHKLRFERNRLVVDGNKEEMPQSGPGTDRSDHPDLT